MKISNISKNKGLNLNSKKMHSIIHIKFADINFNCPHCGNKYSDEDDKYLNRCNKNKSGYTTIRCLCQERFGMTYNIQGDAVGFEL